MVPCHQRRAWRRMRNNWRRRRRQIENDDRDVEYGQRRLHLHPWLPPYRSAFGRVLLCFRYQLPPTTDPTPKLYSYFLISTVPSRGHRENKNIILLHHNIDKINLTKTTFQNGSVKFVKNSMRITFAVKKKNIDACVRRRWRSQWYYTYYIIIWCAPRVFFRFAIWRR